MLKLATKFAPRVAALEQAYRAGFRFAELFLDQGLLVNWETILQQAHAYPIGYALHFPNQLDLPLETLEHTAALYRHLGCRCLVIHQRMYDQYCEPLLRLEPELRLAVENHKLDLSGLTDWTERNTGLTLDVEHLWKYTLRDAPVDELIDQVRALLTRLGGKLRHVHLPGYWPGLREHRPMHCSREMVLPVLSLLEEADYEGLVVSEVNPEFQTACDLRMDVLLFDGWRQRRAPRCGESHVPG
jgi:sugar phosphate isomerase/epimerase